MTDFKYKVGDHVQLIENKEEQWPGERGIIQSIDHLSWGISIIVEVTPSDDDDDDGLREVTADQIVGLIDA